MKKYIISLLLVLSLTAFAGCTSGGNVGDDDGDISSEDTVGMQRDDRDFTTDEADDGNMPYEGQLPGDGSNSGNGRIGGSGNGNGSGNRTDGGSGIGGDGGINETPGIPNGGSISPDGIM